MAKKFEAIVSSSSDRNRNNCNIETTTLDPIPQETVLNVAMTDNPTIRLEVIGKEIIQRSMKCREGIIVRVTDTPQLNITNQLTAPSMGNVPIPLPTVDK